MEVLSGKMPWQDTLRGTVDFLMGEIDLDKLLSFNGIDNLKVMTGFAANSADVVNLFSSSGLPKFIEEVRPHFDLSRLRLPAGAALRRFGLDRRRDRPGSVMIYRAGKMARGQGPAARQGPGGHRQGPDDRRHPQRHAVQRHGAALRLLLRLRPLRRQRGSHRD